MAGCPGCPSLARSLPAAVIIWVILNRQKLNSKVKLQVNCHMVMIEITDCTD